MKRSYILIVLSILLLIVILFSADSIFDGMNIKKQVAIQKETEDDFINNDNKIIEFLKDQLPDQTVEGFTISHKEFFSPDLAEVGIHYRIDYGTNIGPHYDYFLLQKGTQNNWSLIAKAPEININNDDAIRLKEWHTRIYQEQVKQAQNAIDKKFRSEIYKEGPSLVGYYGGTVEKLSDTELIIHLGYWVEWDKDKNRENRLMKYIVKLKLDSESNWIIEAANEIKN
ncbi:MAG TPA: hypothetical protein VEF53_20340 [Patescibacteria group bacterium]|nr:hypothetical protein [Patescibacteria group bacterium]